MPSVQHRRPRTKPRVLVCPCQLGTCSLVPSLAASCITFFLLHLVPSLSLFFFPFPGYSSSLSSSLSFCTLFLSLSLVSFPAHSSFPGFFFPSLSLFLSPPSPLPCPAFFLLSWFLPSFSSSSFPAYSSSFSFSFCIFSFSLFSLLTLSSPLLSHLPLLPLATKIDPHTHLSTHTHFDSPSRSSHTASPR